jgi:hypothetical protein
VDPITTAVLAALGSVGQSAVKDAYGALKTLIARKFGADSRLSQAVQDLESKPESGARRAVLEEEVASAGAETDAEILAAARGLLESAAATGAHLNAHASGERSVAIGGGMSGGTIVTGNQGTARPPDTR